MDLRKLENVILKMISVQNCYAIWNEKEQKLHLCISQVLNLEKEYEILRSDVMNNLQNLPSFYRPDNIHLINNFPLTANGKVCLESLMKICTENKNSHKLSIESMEIVFRNLWKLLAGSFECGFTKSGGTSVAALQIVNSLSEKFDKEFPELLGLLLNDANYSECLAYIKKQVKNNKESEGNNSEPKTEVFASFSSDASKEKNIEKAKKVQENFINCQEELIDKCLWQRCRGFTSGEDGLENEKEISLKKKVKFEIVKSFDLKKCIDASATIFQNFKYDKAFFNQYFCIEINKFKNGEFYNIYLTYF